LAVSEEQTSCGSDGAIPQARSATVTGVHPVAKLFPLMDEKTFDELLEDIEAHGQLVPIWLHEGQIIDGRNRYHACLELGIEPQFREWDRRGDLVDFVLGLNLKRRHLTATQRAVVAFRMLPVLEAKAKERQGRRAEAVDPEILPERKGDSRDEAAAMVSVSGRYVSDVKRIAAEAPEKLKELETGTLTLQAAKRQIAGARGDGEKAPAKPGSAMKLAAEAIGRLAKIEEDGPQVLVALDRVRAYVESRIRHAAAKHMEARASGALADESQIFLFKE
jgi:ParB-like chromosome segregation protein Spo0J